MAAVTGLTLVKQFTYRGDPLEEWSNQYWFTGAVPAGSVPWKALADALIVVEKTIYNSDHRVLRAYGYGTDNPEDNAVWSYDYEANAAAVSGTFNASLSIECPGDCAAWVRWRTDRLNTKGRPIYLRKYYHGVTADSSTTGGRDNVDNLQRDAYQALGDKLMNGTFIDGRTIRSQLHAESGLPASTSLYVTTRTLKRRGKRP